MCWFAMFLVYSAYIYDMVMIYADSIHLFVELLVHYSSVLGDNDYVGVVLRYDLSVDASYIPGQVVDRGCDIPVESSVVYSLIMRLVEHGYKDRLALFLIFLHNLHDV
jgi:hypothetical protein